MKTYEEHHAEIMKELRERAVKERAWLEPEVCKLRDRNEELKRKLRQFRKEDGGSNEVEKMTVAELYEERHALTDANWNMAKKLWKMKREKEAQKAYELG